MYCLPVIFMYTNYRYACRVYARGESSSNIVVLHADARRTLMLPKMLLQFKRTNFKGEE